MIGSLLYLNASTTDIVYSVVFCARFQSCPKELHLIYLKGTQDMVLWYPTGDSFELIGYVYADYGGYLIDNKSTSGMTHFFGSYLISWV